MGTVTSSDPSNSGKYICTFRIKKQLYLFKLIQIFTQTSLNGVKFWDF